MANMQVTVVDGNNVTVSLDRGVAGVGIASISLVVISGANYLLITYTNGTTQTVGPIGVIQYNATTPINISGSTISLLTVPVNLGGTGQTTAAAGLNALLPVQTSQANKYLQTNGTNASWDAVSLSTADITGVLPVANGGTGVSTSTGTGNTVLSTSPTLVTPALGTPSALVGTNITGTATAFTASNVTTNANLTGDVTSVGNATTLTNAPVIAKVLTGYVSGAGTVAATDSILQAIQKLNGNDSTNANLTGAVTSVGNATSLGSFTSLQLLTALTDETGTGANVFATSPTLVTPALGTPSSGVVTNLTGTASININGTVGATTPTTGSFTNITGSANAIISVTDNTNAALRITQLGTGNALLVEDSTNPDSTPFVIDNNGNALVNATSSVAGFASIASPLQVNNGGGIAAAFSRFSADGNDASVQFLKSRNATYGSQTIVQSGDNLGTIRFAASDGTAFIQAATISSAVDGTPGTNDMPGRLAFSTTADGASSPTERMRINSVGSVGIGGTPSAGQTLSLTKAVTGAVASNVVFNSATIASDVTTVARGYFSSFATQAAAFTLTTLEHFRANQSTIGAASAVTQQFGFNVDSTLTGATNNFGFYSNIASGANRYNFYAAGTADNYFAGGVGVGTAAPASRLHVRQDQDAVTRSIIQNRNGTGTPISEITFITGSFDLSDNRYAYIQAFGGSSNSLAFGTSNSGTPTERLRIDALGVITARIGTAIPAGGTAGFGYCATSTANFGVFFGSGAPTLSAAKGSLYLRSDGTTVNDRMYVNTDGSTTWTNVVTSA